MTIALPLAFFGDEHDIPPDHPEYKAVSESHSVDASGIALMAFSESGEMTEGYIPPENREGEEWDFCVEIMPNDEQCYEAMREREGNEETGDQVRSSAEEDGKGPACPEDRQEEKVTPHGKRKLERPPLPQVQTAKDDLLLQGRAVASQQVQRDSCGPGDEGQAGQGSDHHCRPAIG